MSKTETLTIGKLAASAGVGRETIRYYERQGLIDAPPRSPAGYHTFHRIPFYVYGSSAVPKILLWARSICWHSA